MSNPQESTATPTPAATPKMSFADIAKSFATPAAETPADGVANRDGTATTPAAAETTSATTAPVFKHRDDAARKAAQDADRARLEAKRAEEAKDARIAALEARIAEAEGNPIAALKLAKGMTPAQFAEKLAKGELELEEPSATPELPEDVRSMVQWAKDRQKAEAEAKAKAEQEAAHNAAVDLTKKALEAYASDFPMTASFDGAPAQLAAAIQKAHGGPDNITEEEFREMCKGYEDYVLRETRATLSKPAALKAILADAGTKTALLEALGLSSGQRNDDRQPSETNGAASGEPRTLSTRVAGTVSPQKRGLSYREIADMFKVNGE